MASILRFLRSDQGATSVEYAVMLGLILLACIAAVIVLGQQTSASYTGSAQSITNAMSS